MSRKLNDESPRNSYIPKPHIFSPRMRSPSPLMKRYMPSDDDPSTILNCRTLSPQSFVSSAQGRRSPLLSPKNQPIRTSKLLSSGKWNNTPQAQRLRTTEWHFSPLNDGAKLQQDNLQKWLRFCNSQALDQILAKDSRAMKRKNREQERRKTTMRLASPKQVYSSPRSGAVKPLLTLISRENATKTPEKNHFLTSQKDIREKFLEIPLASSPMFTFKANRVEENMETSLKLLIRIGKAKQEGNFLKDADNSNNNQREQIVMLKRLNELRMNQIRKAKFDKFAQLAKVIDHEIEGQHKRVDNLIDNFKNTFKIKR